MGEFRAEVHTAPWIKTWEPESHREEQDLGGKIEARQD